MGVRSSIKDQEVQQRNHARNNVYYFGTLQCTSLTCAFLYSCMTRGIDKQQIVYISKDCSYQYEISKVVKL
jgi:hypothetical protein